MDIFKLIDTTEMNLNTSLIICHDVSLRISLSNIIEKPLFLYLTQIVAFWSYQKEVSKSRVSKTLAHQQLKKLQYCLHFNTTPKIQNWAEVLTRLADIVLHRINTTLDMITKISFHTQISQNSVNNVRFYVNARTH